VPEVFLEVERRPRIEKRPTGGSTKLSNPGWLGLIERSER